MCRNPTTTQTEKSQPWLLLSLKSYGTKPPKETAIWCTIFFFLSILCMAEQLLRYAFFSVKDMYPFLEKELDRQILARHIGIDCFSCIVCAILGLQASPIIREFFDHVRGIKKGMEAETYEKRLFTYHPQAYRLGAFFMAYQIHDLYDALVWDDGAAYVFHHIVSMIPTFLSMYPGCAGFYVIFFVGISEISTAVLCLLANFDEDGHGVQDLGIHLPVTKIVLASTFVVLFITIRSILWPAFSYYFIRDCMQALKEKDDNKTVKPRAYAVRVMAACDGGLTVLQIMWLGQIFITLKAEIEKLQAA